MDQKGNFQNSKLGSLETTHRGNPSQQYLLYEPPTPQWRNYLFIAFGILLPVFFGTVGCWSIIASRAPLWAMAIGAIVGLGSVIISSMFNLFMPNSEGMRSWMGAISAAMLLITGRITAECAIPEHQVSFAFTAAYVFSYSIGVFVGILSLNSVAGRLRT